MPPNPLIHTNRGTHKAKMASGTNPGMGAINPPKA